MSSPSRGEIAERQHPQKRDVLTRWSLLVDIEGCGQHGKRFTTDFLVSDINCTVRSTTFLCNHSMELQCVAVCLSNPISNVGVTGEQMEAMSSIW
jgi:hypothetical protein